MLEALGRDARERAGEALGRVREVEAEAHVTPDLHRASSGVGGLAIAGAELIGRELEPARDRPAVTTARVRIHRTDEPAGPESNEPHGRGDDDADDACGEPREREARDESRRRSTRADGDDDGLRLGELTRAHLGRELVSGVDVTE